MKLSTKIRGISYIFLALALRERKFLELDSLRLLPCLNQMTIRAFTTAQTRLKSAIGKLNGNSERPEGFANQKRVPDENQADT